MNIKFNISLFCLFLFAMMPACILSASALPDSQTFVSDSNESSKIYNINAGDILNIIYDFSTASISVYRFTVSDLLEIRFISDPELTVEQRVRHDGFIALPYIGDMHVIDLTPEELRKSLILKYKAFLKSPEILVLLKEPGGKLGELIRISQNKSQIEIPVRSDGFASFPYAGDIKVSGLSLKEAEAAVSSLYKSTGVFIPVSLSLSKPEGSIVTVFGAVNKPGSFPFLNEMSIFQAIAASGGLRNDARPGKIAILRKSDNGFIVSQINLKKLLKGKTEESRVFSGDIVYIPRKGLASAGDIAQQLGQLLFFRGFTIDAGRYILP
jgi:polysaccharide export outer membrane protein